LFNFKFSTFASTSTCWFIIKKVVFYFVKPLVFRNFVLQKNHNKMLYDKSTKIISEFKNYFSSNEKIFQTLFSGLRSLKISDKHFAAVDKINTKYVGYHRFILLFLLKNIKIKQS
jgi:hypothetical protein